MKKKKRYYITLNNKKIQVPYKIQNSKLTNYTIIDQMFPTGIPEPYWDVASKIMLAIKEGEPQQWEDAGFLLQGVIEKTGDKTLSSWASHFFNVCYRLENKGKGISKRNSKINIPNRYDEFIVPYDTDLGSKSIKLTKRYKLEKGIV